MGELLQGVPKKVGFTATITSSKSHFFMGHLVVIQSNPFDKI